MGCPHGDVSGECPKCARAEDKKRPPPKEKEPAKPTGKLRITDHGQHHFWCKYCKTVPRFKVVRAQEHKTQVACLNCGKEQSVYIKFAEEDTGQHNTFVTTTTPRSKRKWDMRYRR